MKKLAIISTHPIQYNAPLFALLNERGKIAIKVFYTWENAQNGIYDHKFKQNIKWDIPLLQNYDYQFVKNTAKNQGSHNFRGIINPTLIKEIENWQADSVLIYGWNFLSHVKAMRYFKGRIPVLFRGDSTLLHETQIIKTFLRRIWLTFVYRYIDYALYVGKNNKDYFLKHGLKSEQLFFAPHSIDNQRFNKHSKKHKNKSEQWRKELNISENNIVILFAGKFDTKKNPMLILEVAKHFQNSNFKFILAGAGSLEDKIKSVSKNLDNVILLPFQNQSQMPILYGMADVFVLPSSGMETWGLAINEAMACKTAIIASKQVGCVVDLVHNNRNGFIIDTNNLDDLIHKIKSLDKNKTADMGVESQKIIKNYSFTKVCEVIEHIVNDSKN